MVQGELLGTRDKPEEPLISIGRITKPHGLQGELVFLPYVYDIALLPELVGCLVFLRQGSKALQSCTIAGWREFRKRVLIQIVGCETMTAAEQFREYEVLIPRHWFPALPEGEYYWFEIEGLQVWSDQGTLLGRIAEIIYTGSNDVYVIHNGQREILVPALKTVVRNIDIACGAMHLYPMAELFDS